MTRDPKENIPSPNFLLPAWSWVTVATTKVGQDVPQRHPDSQELRDEETKAVDRAQLPGRRGRWR
jgi:hypothetical protein